MKKETYYFILLFIQTTFCSNGQITDDNKIAFQKTKKMTKSYDVLFSNRYNMISDSLIIADNNYQSYRTAYIISESIAASLIGIYARSSLNNGTSTNIGLLYSGIGVSAIGFILNLKANKIKALDELARFHDVSKTPILTIAPLFRNEKGFNEFGVTIQF
jgi:coproporphyrinogen III oxidase-like Fe-S oxidoreductase